MTRRIESNFEHDSLEELMEKATGIFRNYASKLGDPLTSYLTNNPYQGLSELRCAVEQLLPLGLYEELRGMVMTGAKTQQSLPYGYVACQI